MSFEDTIHIPSTSNDIDLMTLNFKNVLGSIFHQKRSRNNADGIDDMCLDSLPLPASVTVKGPLNVQQYYDLSGKKQKERHIIAKYYTYPSIRNKPSAFEIR